MYGNFFQDDFVTNLATNDPMPWNRMARTAGVTLDPDTVTIRVAQAGDYYIDYHVNANLGPTGVPVSDTAIMAIFVGGSEVNPIQTRYGAFEIDTNVRKCVPISGGTIVFIPADGTVQLRNVGPTFSTCDNNLLAASINLIKVS